MSTTGTGRPIQLVDTAFDAERRVDLARMRRRATALLAMVAVIWLVLIMTTDGTGWSGFAIAAAEAGMVGGLADWFAVTALFRHPLGIPIPHTAVVTARKSQFGATLGDFVQQNFLSADVVGQRVADIGVARRVGEWLADPDHAEVAARHLAGVVSRLAESARDAEVTGLIESEIRRRVEDTDAAAVLGRVLGVLTVDGRYEPLMDELLGVVDRFLVDSEPTLRRQFTAEAPWWLPEPIDEAIFQRLMVGVRSLIAEASTPREGPGLRQEIHTAVETFVRRLEYDPVMAERAAEIKRDLLDNPQLAEWVQSVWQELKHRIQVQSDTPDSVLRARMTAAVVAIGRQLLVDEDLAGRMDALAERTVRAAVEQFRGELSGLVSGTIDRWDPSETSDRLELLLGRDLQFIRINGTVVGALAGLVIHSIARVAG